MSGTKRKNPTDFCTHMNKYGLAQLSMAWNGIYAQYLIANKNDNDYNEYMKKSKIVRVVYIDAEAVWCIEK